MRARLLCLAMLLTSCGLDFRGGGGGGAETQFSGQAVKLIANPGALRNANGVLQGTGTSIFRQPLLGVNSAASYEVEFTLQNNGELILLSHGDENLNGAFQIRFLRRGAGRNSLNLTLQAGGATRGSINDQGVDLFSNVDASLPLRFQVDVHNDEGAASHVLIWDITRTRDVFNPFTALLNTSDPRKSNYGSPGRGAADRWGMQLQNATVARGLLSTPKFLD